MLHTVAEGCRPRVADISRVDRPAPQGVRFGARNLIKAYLLLFLREHADYGYSLSERLRAIGLADGNPGATYRALRFLEDTGFVVSSWTASAAGPAKRVYAVTPAGDDMLTAWTETLVDTQSAIAAYLDHYTTVRRSDGIPQVG